MSQLMELFPVNPAQPDLSLQITPPTICSSKNRVLTTTTAIKEECNNCSDINIGGGLWKNRSSSSSFVLTNSTTTTTTTSNPTSSVERSQLSYSDQSPILIDNQKQGLVMMMMMMMKPRPIISSSGRPYMAIMAVDNKKTEAGSSSRFPIKRGTNRAPRMRWTTTLHARFLHAIHLLGGHHRATPKSLLELMDVKDLTLAHVKSHLQMYRTLKTTDRSTTVSSGRKSNGWRNPSYSRKKITDHSRRNMTSSSSSSSLEEKYCFSSGKVNSSSKPNLDFTLTLGRPSASLK